MDINFRCDKCGQNLEVDEAGAGMTVDCPKCGKPVYVPTKPTETDSEKRRAFKAREASPYAESAAKSSEDFRAKAELAKYLEQPRRTFTDWSMGEYLLAFGAAVAIVVVAVLFLRWDAQRRQSEQLRQIQENANRQMQDLYKMIPQPPQR